MAGETGPVQLSQGVAMVIAAFFALSCYNVFDITISIFTIFKRRRGLYFWSMVIATYGILLHTISAFLRFFALAPNFPMCVLIVLGWWAMVTGQSVVLYSRLHLITTDERPVRFVLYMIILNFCILHIPVSVLFFGSNLNDDVFIEPFNIYEKIQLAGFCLQEIIISGLYIWQAVTVLKPILKAKATGNHNSLIYHLVAVNAIVVLLDASLLATEYTNHFDVQTTYKPVVYSIKLRMEFSVLNRLIDVIRTSPSMNEYVVDNPRSQELEGT